MALPAVAAGRKSKTQYLTPALWDRLPGADEAVHTVTAEYDYVSHPFDGPTGPLVSVRFVAPDGSPQSGWWEGTWDADGWAIQTYSADGSPESLIEVETEAIDLPVFDAEAE